MQKEGRSQEDLEKEKLAEDREKLTDFVVSQYT
jgi:hypothetical protein